MGSSTCHFSSLDFSAGESSHLSPPLSGRGWYVGTGVPSLRSAKGKMASVIKIAAIIAAFAVAGTRKPSQRRS
jgi:hypothetical protein